MNITNGLVIKSIGGLYFVESPVGVLECNARGIFRKNNVSPYVGDNVKVEEITENRGIISQIYERRNSIIRPPLANIDRLVFVVSTCEPSPNYAILDKFIAIAEFKDIATIIAVTKRDLLINDEIRKIYSNSGAEIFEIDYENSESVNTLHEKLKDGVTVFTGNTGVGKSTLLNAINPSLKLATGEISRKLGRGKHTTRHVELHKLSGDNNGGYIADTPGFSTFEMKKYEIIHKDKLELCFREFEPYLGKCKFQGCSHTKENPCEIIKAVDNGDIPKSRYNSYLMMYDEARNIKDWE